MENNEIRVLAGPAQIRRRYGAGPIDTRMLPNREDVAKRVPLGRTGTPEEAAAAIAFLLDEATYTTGCTLDVCGGQYMN